MKKHFLKILILTVIVSGVFYLSGGWDKLFNPSTIRAFGDLLVDFHVSIGTPIFNVTNMKPGDSQTRPIDVTNNGTVARYISAKGFRNTGVGNAPLIESVLSVVIKNGSTLVYGPKTLANFFTDSADPNGIPLGIVNSGGHKTYNFNVSFPTSADNKFQAKSVTVDLTFGTITSNSLVINEVYYNVDAKHGLNEPKNKNDKDDEDDEKKLPKKRSKFQWVEIYNPTNKEVSLKGWSLTDNSGKAVTINANKKIPAGGFALLSKDSSVWKYWQESKNVLKVELGSRFGDGLDINGDRLILKNASSAVVDKMSWGSDISGFTPPGTNPMVTVGHSTERLVPAFDTDKSTDWADRNPPTTGK